MTKPRLRFLADGRIGFPGVVEYVLTTGPDAGRTMLAPPTLRDHEDPDALKTRATRSTFLFRRLILDLDAFEQLRGTGLIYHARHVGLRGAMVDNRPAPGS